MSTDFRGAYPAELRLAQTRNEIRELILPRRSSAPSSAQARRAARERAAAQAAAATPAERAAAARFADVDPRPTAASSRRARAAARPASFGWGPMFSRGASIWWRHHPAHAAIEVADSMLAPIARRKPFHLLGVAAGVGALAMLVRPWRLVSVTGLAFAALKMTDVRSLFGSLRGD